MSGQPRRAASAGIAAGLSVAVGLITNLLTGGPAVPLVIGFIVLTVAYVALVMAMEGRGAKAKSRHLPIPRMDGRVIERASLVDALVAKLLSRNESGLTVALHGAGGFGKTTIALLAARRTEVSRHFRGGVFWVALGQDCVASELAARVNDVIEQLTGERPSLSDPIQAGLRLGQALDSRRRTLLIVDDVWNVEQLEPFMAGGDESARLVTTRIPHVLPANAAQLRVDAMVEQDAQKLLTWQCPLARASVEAIVDIAGAWPLLLAMLNSGLRRAVAGGLTPDAAAARVIARLRQHGPAAFDPLLGANKAGAVAATVQASLTLLDPLQRSRYVELAIFPEDSEIPREALCLLWELDSEQVDHLCEEFAQMSLVMRYQPDRGSIQLHDVLLAYLRSAAGDDRLRIAHERLLVNGRKSLPPGAPWWMLPENADYLWRRLFHHLVGAGRGPEADGLVHELRWIERKLELYGPAETELDLIHGTDPVTTSLRRAIAQSAHLLSPTIPPAAVADILRTRIEGTKELLPLVAAARQGAYPGRLKLFWPLPDQPSALLRRVIPGHGEPLSGCSASADGAWLALLGMKGTVWIRDTSGWSVVATVRGHADAVRGCVVSPHRDWMATVADDGVLAVWSTTTWSVLRTFRAAKGTFTSCALSPDGSRLITTGTACTAAVWDTATWTVTATLTGHRDIVTNCAVSPDGTFVVTTSNDRTFRLWSLADGQPKSVHRWHKGAVTACSISADGRWLATAGNDRRIRILDLVENKTVLGLTGHSGRITSCAFAPDRTWLVTTSNDGTARIFAATTRTRWEVLEGHEGHVTGGAIVSDGRYLATVSHDGALRVWESTMPKSISTLQSRHRTSGCPALALSPDGTWLLAATDSGKATLWDLVPHSQRAIVASHKNSLTSCAIAADGGMLLTGSTDGTCSTWITPARGAADARLTDGRSGRRRSPDQQRLVTTYKHRQGTAVTACAINSDASMVASADVDGAVRLWLSDETRPPVVLKGSARPALTCAFSPDDALLASGGGDGAVWLWDVRSGQLRSTLRGHVGAISQCVFTPDGNRLVSVGQDRTVRIWHRDGRLLHTLTGHSDRIRSCAVSGEALAATVDRAGVLRLWNLDKPECLTMWRADGPLHSCSFRNDTIALGGSKGIYLLTVL